MTKKKTTSIVVDKNNFIVGLGDGWNEEAQKGKALQALAFDKVLEHRLSSFIKDDNTVMYIEACLSLCRVKKETLYRSYRCDSPTQKQFMELELVPLEQGKVQMNHYLLKTEDLERPFYVEDVTNKIDKKQKPLKRNYVLRCSMCNSIKPPNQDEWIELTAYLKMPQAKTHEQVIHTVCEKCKNKTWEVRRPD